MRGEVVGKRGGEEGVEVNENGGGPEGERRERRDEVPESNK
jgi:hypothetical protein